MPTRPPRFAVARLAREGACVGVDAYLFDATTPANARPALAYCRACPVIDLCSAVVKPRASWFDGVAAGRLWRNGKALTPALKEPRHADDPAAVRR